MAVVDKAGQAEYAGMGVYMSTIWPAFPSTFRACDCTAASCLARRAYGLADKVSYGTPTAEDEAVPASKGPSVGRGGLVQLDDLIDAAAH